jgi:hypothetical protein
MSRLATGHISARTAPKPTPVTNPGSHGDSTGPPASRADLKGCALSSSQTTTFTALPDARSALAMPQARPPPPNGTKIASTSGTSSRISAASVPLPASAAGSRTASMYTVSNCEQRPDVTALHQSAKGWWTMRASSDRISSSLDSAAPSGTTAVAVIPARLATHASASALLPELNV